MYVQEMCSINQKHMVLEFQKVCFPIHDVAHGDKFKIFLQFHRKENKVAVFYL